MTLAEAILVAMELAVPVGRSAWSVEPVPVTECAPEATACPGAKRSSFYGGWVRKESAEAGRARYAKLAAALAAEAKSPEEAALAVGVAVNESGLREDVMMGRGRSGKPSDDGGQGRGPGNEACVMQILPSMAKAFGGPQALLGDSDEALRRCFRAGLEQLRWARSMCPLRLRGPHISPLWATVARYGTGHSCTSPNQGKTARRVRTAEWMTVVIRQQMAKGS